MTASAPVRWPPRSTAAFTAAVGCAVLAGWLLDAPRVASLVPGLPPMVPNTALGLILAGAGLWALEPSGAEAARRRAGQAAALAVGLIGLATLVEYMAGIAPGIDGLVVRAPPDSPYPHRPAFFTAGALTSAAAALLTLDSCRWKSLRPSDLFASLTLVVGVVTLAAYGYGIEALDTLPRLGKAFGVSLPTAACLIALGWGLLTARPETGLAAIVRSPYLGGFMARRLLAGALLLVPLLAALGILGQRAGLYPAAGSMAITMASALAVVVASILMTARSLSAADAQREASQERLRNLIEQASDGIFVADLEGRYVSVNDAGCRMLGYAREELVGKSILDLLPPADGERLRASKERLAGGETEVGEWQLRRKDGSYLPVEVSAKILPDGQWQGLVRDVSARREREGQRFRLALESAANAMALVDEQGTVVFANRQAAALSGYPLDELQGLGVDALVPERFRAGHPAQRARYFQSGELHRAMAAGHDIAVVRKDGVEVPVEVWLTLVTLDERPFAAASIADISARKRAEKALRDNEARLRAAVAELEAYSYTISHNLRAPLRAIEGYASLVEGRLGGIVDDESRLMLRRIKEAGQRLDRMVKDLLSYSAVSHAEPQLEAVDLDELLAVEAGHYPELGPGGLVIRRPLGRVRGQPSLVLQAVSNLLRNAARSIPEGRAPRVEVRCEVKEGGLRRLAVEDNGVGLPPDALGKIFDPFERRRAGSDQPGIGLAIVRRAVERMGGRVGVESKLGEGSCFWLELPAA